MDADFGWSRLRSVKCEERCDEAQETRQSQRHTRSTHQTPVTWPCFARDIGSFLQSSGTQLRCICHFMRRNYMYDDDIWEYGHYYIQGIMDDSGRGVCMGTSYSMR